VCVGGAWQQQGLGCACQLPPQHAAVDGLRAPDASDGGCITPTVGQACTTSELACQPHDPCCAGYEWTCDVSTGTWQQVGLGCACAVEAGLPEAGPFTCGTATCPGADFCEDHPPGIRNPDGSVPPDSYECNPIPSSCSATPTCACIEATLSSSDPCSTQPSVNATCTDDAGHVIIHCIGV
jgi:hypothetical protein